MSDGATTAVVLAAIAVAVVFLVALARRLGWGPTVRAAWDDVLGCAVEAARVVRARPRVLWPAAILLGLALGSWAAQPALRMQFEKQRMSASAAMPARPANRAGSQVTSPPVTRSGRATGSIARAPERPVTSPLPSYWEMLPGARDSRRGTLQEAIQGLAYAWQYLPGQVARYLWGAISGGGIVLMVVRVIVLVALAATVRRWAAGALTQGAEPSAQLLLWLIGPSIVIGGLLLYSMGSGVWFRRVIESRVLMTVGMVPVLLPVTVWAAGVRGAVLDAVRRAIAGQDPWSVREIAWGALRNFKALFWLAFWPGLFMTVGQMFRFTEFWQSLSQVLWAIYRWAFVALLLAPAAIVSEGTGALGGARLALRAWWRAPWHLGISVVLGAAALWVSGLVGWAAGSAVEDSGARVPLGIAVVLLRLCLESVVVIWAAAVALLLWQRVRGRVMAPAS